MDSFRIEWKPSAVRELRRLERQALERIVRAVESLASNPFPAGSRKLQGGDQSYRIRIGDYRVVYEIFQSRLLIQIVRVGHRKDVYR